MQEVRGSIPLVSTIVKSGLAAAIAVQVLFVFQDTSDSAIGCAAGAVSDGSSGEGMLRL